MADMKVAELVAHPGLDLRLRAGRLEGTEVVTWVHTIGMSDPRPWLTGGELLLTTGQGVPTTSRQAGAYVRRLRGADVPALGFGIEPYAQAVPEHLIRACDRHGLPLIEVPAATPFVAISRLVGQWWSNHRAETLQHALDSQRRITRAAVGEAPVQEVLSRLTTELGAWAMVRVEGGVEVMAGEVPEQARVIDHFATQHRTRAVGLGQWSVIVQDLPVTPGPAVLVVGREHQLERFERASINVAEAVLTALLGRETEPAVARVGEVAVRLLVRGDQDAAVTLMAALDPQGQQDSWMVVATEPHREVPRVPAPEGWSAVVEGVRYSLVHEGASGSLLEELGAREVPTGVGVAATTDDLSGATEQAQRFLLLARGRGAGQSSVVGPRRPSRSVGLLAGAPDPVAAQSFLAPLLADPATPQLVPALWCWLETNGHWDRTASALQVHRHTARARVKRSLALLELDPDSAADRFEAWLALSATGPVIPPR